MRPRTTPRSTSATCPRASSRSAPSAPTRAQCEIAESPLRLQLRLWIAALAYGGSLTYFCLLYTSPSPRD
eukprot:8290432-Alexandrium_andersonii.AAC.1